MRNLNENNLKKIKTWLSEKHWDVFHPVKLIDVSQR